MDSSVTAVFNGVSRGWSGEKFVLTDMFYTPNLSIRTLLLYDEISPLRPCRQCNFDYFCFRKDHFEDQDQTEV